MRRGFLLLPVVERSAAASVELRRLRQVVRPAAELRRLAPARRRRRHRPAAPPSGGRPSRRAGRAARPPPPSGGSTISTSPGSTTVALVVHDHLREGDDAAPIMMTWMQTKGTAPQ